MIHALLTDPTSAIVQHACQPQLPGLPDPVSLHFATLGEMLYADLSDYLLMRRLADIRRHEDEIDEEIRDPESSISQGYCVVAGNRSYPTARYLITEDRS